MSEQRPPKKSETLEVRVPHEVKDALMRKAHAEGRSASDVVRTCIADYLDGDGKEGPSMLSLMWKPVAAASAVGIFILWSALAPAPLNAGPDLKAAFEHLDQDHDNAVSLSEFLGRNPDMMFVNKAQEPGDAAAAKTFMLPIRRELPAPLPGAVKPPKDMLQGEFAREDRDGNGRVTYAEFEAYHRQIVHDGFAGIDSNGDGFLEQPEYAAARAAAPGDAGAGFDELDANRDGRISEAEFLH